MTVTPYSEGGKVVRNSQIWGGFQRLPQYSYLIAIKIFNYWISLLDSFKSTSYSQIKNLFKFRG